MSTVKSAFLSLTERIGTNQIFKLNSLHQDKNKEIRFSKKIDFNEDAIQRFEQTDIILSEKIANLGYFKDPYILHSLN